MAQKEEKGALSTVGKIRLECIVPVPFAPDGELNSPCSLSTVHELDSQGQDKTAAYVYSNILKLCTHTLAHCVTGLP